ncbi:MAG: T9SS type A sorting domain-containing protein [Bacteroidota bacterium]
MNTNSNAILIKQRPILGMPVRIPFVWLFFGIFLLSGLQLSGQNNPCGCTNLNVSLNDNCQFPLFLKNIFPNAGNTPGSCDTTGMVLKIADLNSNNNNIIDGISPQGVGWSYGVFKGTLVVCQGTISATDDAPPVLNAAAFALIDTIDLWCNDVNLVNNVDGSWRVPGYRYYMGMPAFTDLCGGQIQIKVTDFLSNTNCQSDSIFATLRRSFQAIDARSNDTTINQIIRFKRPSSALFLPPPSRDTLIYNVCSSSQIQGGVDSVIKANYRAVHPRTGRDVSLFDLTCAYTTSVVKNTIPVCQSGEKVFVQVEVWDWCTGNRFKDTMMIKAYDIEKPVITTIKDTVDISTSPVSCEAELNVDTTNLALLYGMKITDNCATRLTFGYRIQSLDRVTNGFPQPSTTWFDGVYPAVVRNGKTFYTGITYGRHRLIMDVYDNCQNLTRDTFYFNVVDRVPPTMICDNQLNVTLTTPTGSSYYDGVNEGLSYAKISINDINEGSRDNCTVAQLKMRRTVEASCLDNFLTNTKYDLDQDGDIREHFTLITSGNMAGNYYTPLVDFAEFYCCDVFNPVMVELHGTDIQGNTSFCWLMLNIEDKTTPFCQAPAESFFYCNKPEDRFILYDVKTANARFGTPVIGGLECSGTVEYSLDSSLTCGAGFYTRKWVAVKTIKGQVVRTNLCTQRVRVLPVHEYDILFPADINLNCQVPTAIPVMETYEVACDILAVNLSITKFAADSSETNVCSKEYRTYTVINWCEMGEWASSCPNTLDPAKFTQVIPRSFDQNRDGQFNGTYDVAEGTGFYLLVRDRELNNTTFTRGTSPGTNGVEEFFISKDRVPTNYSSFNYRERVFPATQDNSPKPLGTPFTFKNDNKSCFLPNPIWPTFSRDSTPAFSYQYTQIVKIFDSTPPIVNVPVPDTFPTFPNTCLANVDVRFKAADVCPSNLTITAVSVALNQGNAVAAPVTFQSDWTLTANSGMTTDSLATGSVRLKNLPEGKHDLIVSVRDGCGNVAVSRIPFVVADKIATPPLCLNGVVTGLMPGANGEGMMVVWASDFISAAVFDCNGQGAVSAQNNKQNQITHYSINRVGEPFNRDSTSITLMCSDTADLVFVEIHGWDKKGNHNYCTTYINVEDNINICKGSGAASISGVITNENQARLEGVSVKLSGTANATVNTAIDGRYSIPSLALNRNYTVKPSLNKGFLNGITTFDLVLISKHILNVQPFDSPYKIIAADVNNSKTLSTIDLIQLRKLILGVDLTFQFNESWRFVPTSFVFPDPNNPWKTVFPEEISFNPIDGHKRADFIGIKVGDVNGSAQINGPITPGIRSGEEMGEWHLNIENDVVEAGEIVEIPILLKNTKGVEGFQFALQYDENTFDWIDMKQGLASKEFFGLFPKDGLITASWNGSVSDTLLSTLVLQARKKVILKEAISLNSRFMSPEAYINNELFRLGLHWIEKKKNIEYTDIQPNFPNPFKEDTRIFFQIPAKSKVNWKISDLTGKIIAASNQLFDAGEHVLEFEKNTFHSPGIYYFTFESAAFNKTLKMVKLE